MRLLEELLEVGAGGPWFLLLLEVLELVLFRKQRTQLAFHTHGNVALSRPGVGHLN